MGHASILIRDEVKQSLNKLKTEHESYNDVIQRILNKHTEVKQNEN